MENEKKYKELVGKIKKAYLYAQTDSTKAVLEDILPELAESEDERIRKELLDCCKDKAEKYSNDPKYKNIRAWIAWLEKQGEQKPIMNIPSREVILSIWDLGNEWKELTGGRISTEFGTQLEYVQKHWHESEYYLREKQGDKPQGKTALEAIKEKPVDNANKVEQKFKVGDFIVNDYCMGRIVEITNDAYLLDTEQGIPFSCHSTRLWDITKDAKDGDLIYVATEEKGIQAIFHEYKNGTIFFYCYLCGDFAQGGYMPIGSVELAYPLQKIHYNRFFEKMKEAGCEWDAEKKELKLLITNGGDFEQENCEQNSAWSEEDDAYQSFAISAVEDYYDAKNSIQRGLIDWLKSLKDRVGCEANCTTTKELSESDEEEFQIAIDTLVEAGQRDSAHWLESIKDRVQPHWKPSEKQLDALQYVYRNCNPPLSDKLGWDSIRTLELMYQDLKKLKEE